MVMWNDHTHTYDFSNPNTLLHIEYPTDVSQGQVFQEIAYVPDIIHEGLLIDTMSREF